MPSAPSLPIHHTLNWRHGLRRADGVSVADWGDWGLLKKAGKQRRAFDFLVWCFHGFSGLKSRAMKWHFDLTENVEFRYVCVARHSNVPCKKQRSGLGATVMGEPLCFHVLSDSGWSVVTSNHLNSKLAAFFRWGNRGGLPKWRNFHPTWWSWPLGAWEACHVASGIWSRALGWRSLRVKLWGTTSCCQKTHFAGGKCQRLLSNNSYQLQIAWLFENLR